MNGVITDDEEIHELATQQVFEKIGIHLTSETYRELCLGRTDMASFKDIFQKFSVKNQNISDLISLKSSRYQRLIKGNLIVYPGVVELIMNLSKNFTLALTSSSTFEEVHSVVNQLKIKKFFKILVTARDVKHGKPDPEPYLLTAEKLNVKCSECLVIEDSENGVQSAISAGMKCIAITNTEDPINLLKADQIIDGYTSITKDFIELF